MSLGNCKWCGLAVDYADPGNPPADATADGVDFYDETWAPFRDYTLVDSTGSTHCTGAGAQSEQGVAVGQYPVHQL